MVQGRRWRPDICWPFHGAGKTVETRHSLTLSWLREDGGTWKVRLWQIYFDPLMLQGRQWRRRQTRRLIWSGVAWRRSGACIWPTRSPRPGYSSQSPRYCSCRSSLKEKWGLHLAYQISEARLQLTVTKVYVVVVGVAWRRSGACTWPIRSGRPDYSSPSPRYSSSWRSGARQQLAVTKVLNPLIKN